jgi:hypothetical protein
MSLYELKNRSCEIVSDFMRKRDRETLTALIAGLITGVIIFFTVLR